MREGLGDLTDREKETLRLLREGHDAKSAADALGLSVHTINDHLRAARRKLGVSSSRAAARILGDAERTDPKFPAGKQIGIAPAEPAPQHSDHVDRRGVGPFLPWLGGGMLMITLFVAVAMIASGAGDTAGLAQQGEGDMRVSSARADTAGLAAARDWLTLVDEGKWEQSWQEAADFFRSQTTPQSWEAIGEPLGAVLSREFRQVTATDELPGAPAGEYELIEFATDFANRSGAIETVVMVRQGGAWKVDGYFVR